MGEKEKSPVGQLGDISEDVQVIADNINLQAAKLKQAVELMKKSDLKQLLASAEYQEASANLEKSFKAFAESKVRLGNAAYNLRHLGEPEAKPEAINPQSKAKPQEAVKSPPKKEEKPPKPLEAPDPAPPVKLTAKDVSEFKSMGIDVIAKAKK